MLEKFSYPITFVPIYGTSSSGTVTVPSAFWKFSKIAATVLPTARPEPFNVCTNFALSFGSFLYLMLALRA